MMREAMQCWCVDCWMQREYSRGLIKHNFVNRTLQVILDLVTWNRNWLYKLCMLVEIVALYGVSCAYSCHDQCLMLNQWCIWWFGYLFIGRKHLYHVTLFVNIRTVINKLRKFRIEAEMFNGYVADGNSVISFNRIQKSSVVIELQKVIHRKVQLNVNISGVEKVMEWICGWKVLYIERSGLCVSFLFVVTVSSSNVEFNGKVHTHYVVFWSPARSHRYHG